MTNTGSLLPKCLMRTSGRMINTLTIMMRRFPFKNQPLRREVTIVTSCLTKKTVRQMLIENNWTDRFLPTVRRDEPTPQL